MNELNDDDPIVAEVRREREEYAAKFGCVAGGYYASYLRRISSPMRRTATQMTLSFVGYSKNMPPSLGLT